MFVPLTHVSKANGGLFFLEESHLYGPQSRGALDPSRFPPMTEVCPDVEVGDLILCDFLTWHYSLPPEEGNTEERIMIQLNYQPASDASGDYLVAGKFPHSRRHALPSRFEAVSNPSTDVNLPFARGVLEEGDVDRAARYVTGLLYDDPEHAGAALLMCDILAAKNDPTALKYLEQARAAVKKMRGKIAEMDARFGLSPEEGPEPVAAVSASVSSAANPWTSLPLKFYNQIKGGLEIGALPAAVDTPDDEWGYGAISDQVITTGEVAIRVKATAVTGNIGLCLLNDACSKLVSEQHLIKPEDGEAAVMLVLKAADSPARILVRNYGDPGVSGQVRLLDVATREFTPA